MGGKWRDLDVVVDGMGVQQVTTTRRTLRGGVVPLRSNPDAARQATGFWIVIQSRAVR